MINCRPLPASLSSLGGPYCTQLSTFPPLRVNQWIESELPPHLPPDLPSPDRPPASTPPISIDHGLQVHLQPHSITASKCICELHDHGLQVYLQTRLITTSKCIWELHKLGLQVYFRARSITASMCISEFNLISASKCISKLAQSRPPSASPNSLNHGLHVHLWVTRSRPPSASPNSLNHGLQVHLGVQLGRGLQMHLQTHSITASKCISILARSRLPSAPLRYSIKASKCISTPARSWPASASLSSTWYRSPSASPNSLDHSLQVHLPVHTITASKCISKFSQSRSPDTPAITLQYCLQPDWPYVYL